MARVQKTYNPNGPTTEELVGLSTGNPVVISEQMAGKVIVEVDDTEVAVLDEAMESIGFVPAPSDNISVAVDGAIIHWLVATPWSQVLAKINAVPPESGVIVMMDAGTYTMDVAANLDRVMFVGMVESPTEFGGTPTTLNMPAPFTLLGNFLYLTNIVALTTTTVWNGTGPFRMNLMGSSTFTRDLASVVPAIKLGAGGILNVSVSQLSLFGGGSDYTVEMDDGSTINSILTGAGILGDKTAVLKLGAVAATVTIGLDATSVVAGLNGAVGNAFGPGIDSTSSVNKNGNAFFGPYNPTVLANWSGTSPNDIGTALDRIAAAIGPIP